MTTEIEEEKISKYFDNQLHIWNLLQKMGFNNNYAFEKFIEMSVTFHSLKKWLKKKGWSFTGKNRASRYPLQ